MTSVLLILTNAFIFALAAAAVRIQHTLFNGFDVTVGAAVLVGVETFIVATKFFPECSAVSLFVACCTCALSSSGLILVWNFAIVRYWREPSTLGAAILLMSLGAQMMTSGFFGFVRGPGLAQAAWDFGGIETPLASFPLIFGCSLTLMAVILAWNATHLSMVKAVDLFGQNQQLAVEFGIDRRSTVLSASILSGACASVVGCYFAVAEGSRLDLGMNVFLYGCAGALLMPSKTIGASLLGGLLLGAVHMCGQLVVSGNAAQLLIFVTVAILLVVRGSSRSSEGVR